MPLYQRDPGQVDEIRTAAKHELLLGGIRFKEEIEALIQRKVALGKRGRPAKANGASGRGEQLALLGEG